MRDDRARWPAPVADDKLLDLDGALLQPVHGLTQTLISGAELRTQTGLPLIAWPDRPTTDSYAISLRRDRILCIGNPPFDEGWHPDKALAVSDMSDGYTVFDLLGDGALDLLTRGAPSRELKRRQALSECSSGLKSSYPAIPPQKVFAFMSALHTIPL